MRLEGQQRGKVLCEKCRQLLPSASNGVVFSTACETCGALYEGAVFKVDERYLPRAQAVRDVQDVEDAQCFFHPGRQAVAVCSACGRMVCALCDIEQSSGHICPSCINDRRRVDADGRVRRSWAYINAAWSLTILSWVLPVVPGIVALVFAIAGLRNKDYSYNVKRKLSLIASALLALLVMVAYLVLFTVAILA